MINDELIDAAAAVLHPYHVDDRIFGDVASALLTDAGNVYVGVCIDTASGTGFCAEHAAIAAMVTAREYKIAKIVAVWRGDGPLHVVAPCGRCREFIRQIDPSNLDTEVILGRHRTAPLRTLLPETEWPSPARLNATKGARGSSRATRPACPPQAPATCDRSRDGPSYAVSAP